ncbi:S9 family peptidase [Trichocoleus sp. FACHB-591]|uniref:S9 family peptidase n=1 Tax=Trichocoleus sp. FACHB-591 TaxID=2692872 RepID=UPI0016849D0B|nr:S9 family peptidase [Trichocoleus sp. FACHB-591]MBD2098258.1 S9 family peptidase [Trichocoleus sp. FACHB-591]
MPSSQVAAYGTWKSPITSDLIVTGTIGLSQAALDGEDIYWLELRPTEAGRTVLVRRTPDGQTSDVTPAPFNVRTRVHEYGGGAYVVHQGTVYFTHFADQRLYRQMLGSEPRALTPEGNWRYADGVVDESRQRFICVQEDHTAGEQEPVNTIISLSLEAGQEPKILVTGNDFYSSPRLSPDGSHLAWLTWNHPNMPWDGTELWVAAFNPDGSLAEPEKVAGGTTESIFQPEWSPSGILHFISDRSGWWNLYRWQQGQVEALCDRAAEFGEPQWVFGQSTYGFDTSGGSEQIICTYVEKGTTHLTRLNPETQELQPIAIPYTVVRGLQVAAGQAVFLIGSPTESLAIARLDLATGEITVLQRASHLQVDPGYLSEPQAIEFPTENGLTAYAFFYPPKNQDYQAPDGEKPPLLVKSHGGPTAGTSTLLSLSIQYWTSRGIAVLDVDYGGSTGYGRAYRERLKGQWGIVDVDDCVNGARFLAEQGLADGDRLVIDGGSAGGYTTLCALVFRDVFKAGASYYGVSDLEALARDTHKFESRYLDGLIGPYPERQDLYQARSPVHFCDQLACPVIFFQGLEDKIVPPSQAEAMVSVLESKGLPVAYIAFEGEQHGFRKAENIKRSLDGELYFYSRVFDFELADPVEPVAIANL